MCCPDCKDGFYYPLIGPPENCQTCSPLGQAEDRMHRAKLTESEVRQREQVHGFSYTVPSEAQVRRIIESKRTILEASIQDHKDKIDHSVLEKISESWQERDTRLKSIEAYRKMCLKDCEPVIAEIQRTVTGRMESTQPSFQYLKRIRTKPTEYANQLKRLMKMSNLSVAQVAEKISESIKFVQDHLSLLKLPHITQMMVDRDDISLESALLNEIARRNRNIQGTVTGRMESTQPATQVLSRIRTKPIEYAKQLKRMLRRNPSMSVVTLAEKISKPPEFILQYLDLLDLNPEIQQLVDDGVLSIHTILTGEFATSDS